MNSIILDIVIAIAAGIAGYIIGTIKDSKCLNMDMNEFATLIAKKDVSKKPMNIAQVKTILHLVNDELKGGLYELVRGPEEELD